MMIGQKPKIAAQEFTRSNIERLKYTVQGTPIIVDDMVNTRFNQQAIETIKIIFSAWNTSKKSFVVDKRNN